MRRLVIAMALVALTATAHAGGLAGKLASRPAGAQLYRYLATLAPFPLPLGDRTIEAQIYLVAGGRFVARVTELRATAEELEVAEHVHQGLAWEKPVTRELVLGGFALCQRARLGGRLGLVCRLTGPSLPDGIRGQALGFGYIRGAVSVESLEQGTRLD
jgi:hypothetical protein